MSGPYDTVVRVREADDGTYEAFIRFDDPYDRAVSLESAKFTGETRVRALLNAVHAFEEFES